MDAKLAVYTSGRGMRDEFASMYPLKTAEILTQRRVAKRGSPQAFFRFGSPRKLFAVGEFDSCIECKTAAELLAPDLVSKHRLRTWQEVAKVFPKWFQRDARGNVVGELSKPLFVAVYRNVRMLQPDVAMDAQPATQAWVRLTDADRARLAKALAL